MRSRSAMSDLILKKLTSNSIYPGRKMRRSTHITKVNPITSAILFVMLLFCYSISFSQYNYNKWGISKEEVIKRYLQKDNKYVEFDANKPRYENKIMNYIIAIDRDLKQKIKILRSSKKPVRDFLLVNDKLYSVLENQGILSLKKQNKIIDSLTAQFGTPTIQRDKRMTIYSFKGRDTKVLLLSKPESNKIECKIYFYASNLFKMLITQ